MSPATVHGFRSRTPVKTATSPAIRPAEWALISEALRIASDDIAQSAATLERLYPTSPLVERTRIYAESMKDIRERIGLD